MTLQFKAKFVGVVLRPLGQTDLGLEEGEVVNVTVERARSMANHNHQFAEIEDYWDNLPESLTHHDWAENKDTMRKHALIATGWSDVTTVDCGSGPAAQRLKALTLSLATKAHGYAIVQVRGPILTLWTAKSQSIRAMGNEDFKGSKEAVLGWIKAKVDKAYQNQKEGV